MRKLILTMVMLFSIVSLGNAQQTMWFRTTQFAYKYLTEYGYWTDWSDWEHTSVKIKFDTARDLITIYSKEVQIFKVVEQLPSPYDDKGEQVKFRVLDQDYNYANLRLRIEYSGGSQLYVDYNNISYVYNLIRTN